VNERDSYLIKPQQESDGQSFQLLDFDFGRILSTLLFRNTSTDSLLFISLLEETNIYLLVELWEEGRSFGILPILKDEEVNRIIKNEPMERVASFIWQSYQDTQAGMEMLRRKRINDFDRYSSKLNLIARHSAIVMANTVAEIYLFLARKENRDTAGLDEWEKSRCIPDWLDRVVRSLHLLILREFDMYPAEAEAMRNDYWRSVVSFALQDLRKQGITKAVTRKELKAILNRYIFENEEFDGSYKAIIFCGRALAAKEAVRSNVFEKSIEEWDQLLRKVRQPANDRRCKPSTFIFEQEPVFPYGVVEEKIRMSWQNPIGSDLEILHGGVHSDLILSLQELNEEVGEAIKLWRNRKSIWQEARKKLDDPQYCWSFFRWVINEHRRVRRYMRSRYSIEMARRRVLRKASAPRTAKDTAQRAIWYAEATALEAASDAGNFTFVWFRDELTEAGHELFAVKERAIKEAAKASLGVLEAFPLFHLAILNRTSNPAIRDAEIYFLCGIGADVGWRRFPSLYSALSMNEGNKLSKKDTFARLLKELPEAVLYGLNGRQIGEPLVNGRNSFRNRVSQYLRKQENSKPQREYVDSNLLEKVADRPQAKGIRRLAAEDHALVEEARAKIARQINCSRLSPQQQAIMKLKLLEDKSQSEIANNLAMSVDQVKCQQSRAFKKAPVLKGYSRMLVR
jgi:DNA-directed RNA polymerase specialized sigma24 family protein